MPFLPCMQCPSKLATPLFVQVPASPILLYDNSVSQHPLSNNLGSCFTKPGKCANRAMLPFPSSNIYDAALGAGATVSDTLALNPGLNLSGPNPTNLNNMKFPCYAPGSPPGGYLGGNLAFQRPAWGSASGAAGVTATMAAARPGQCYNATGPGAFWEVGREEKGHLRCLRFQESQWNWTQAARAQHAAPPQ
jgi:hypothetical protein